MVLNHFATVTVPDPEVPSVLNWTLIVGLIVFLIVVAAVVVFIPAMFGARKSNVKEQANLVGSFSVPAVALIVMISGAGFLVIGFLAGFFQLGGDEATGDPQSAVVREL